MTRCEAICSFPPFTGQQCPDKSVTVARGRPCCWPHAKAARNMDRRMPLRFVQRGPDLENLLARSIRLAGGTP